MRLSPRLSTIVSLLDLPTKVADIGTDHAYLPIYLAQQTACPTIIASDCNKQPYEAALNHVKKLKVDNKVDVRLGLGLSVLEFNEVDTVIIAGMGSKTIKEILKTDYKLAQSLNRLVLQPMAGADSLRKWLINNEFKIIDEVLVNEEEKLYQILVAEPGIMEVEDQFLLELGPILLEKKDPLLFDYFHRLEKKWQQVINNISKNAPQHPKINRLKAKITRLQQIRSNI